MIANVSQLGGKGVMSTEIDSTGLILTVIMLESKVKVVCFDDIKSRHMSNIASRAVNLLLLACVFIAHAIKCNDTKSS